MADAERIRFHLDEQMDPAIALALRKLGIDVTTTAEADLLGAEDADQLSFGLAQRRVVVTDDTDIIALATAGAPHAGIVMCRRTRYTIGEIIRFLQLLHAIFEAPDMVGHVEWVFEVSG